MKWFVYLLSAVSVSVFLGSAGCAPSSVIPQGENHPAIPTSEPGVARPVSKTLVIDPNDSVKGRDMKGRDMKGRDMKGHDMKGHDMKGHDMKGHDMKGHDMKGHDMKGHDMKGHDMKAVKQAERQVNE